MMPVSPKQVAAFVESCNIVDSVILIIDGILSTPDEQRYRDGSVIGQDYYYTIMVPYNLEESQAEDLRAAYQQVGWPVVQVSKVADGVTEVRLFMNKHSQYFGVK